MTLNGAQWHMLVNHLPVVGFVGLIPLLVAALALKSTDVKRFVLLVAVVVGASAALPSWTGDGAEESVEHLHGVTEHQIHAHEELADKALALALLTSVVAGAAWLLARRKPDALGKSLAVVLGLVLVNAGLMGAVAHEGGLIRHTELGAGAVKGDDAKHPGGEKEDDDEKDEKGEKR